MTPQTSVMPSIEEQKELLRRSSFEAEHKHRIVFVGQFFQGPTGIVASLHRALEELGHTVFQLEAAHHRAAFDRSSGARGGYGPIFFRPEAVARVFEVFEPEVVVFCAGGVVLDPEAAEWFREHDIVTIGLTLSDPDVQDSVIDHVSNFDYHTTNAELALRRYREAGHDNTILMAFGIDKSYVLRDVPPAPDLAADAICIGHASGRPDRHEVMVRLAELVKVRVYGSGWPLPDAVPVEGDRLLQAAHEGAIHVNFPATRAGFTNVKCGVFETIGAGSILATAPFDEMANLFTYGEEILGYTDADDLADQILRLKQDPDAMEALRRRGFARLISEHLYEHRWLQLFHAIERDLTSPASSRPQPERERIAAILSRSHGRPRHVLISGFYGAENRGDDLLLEALAGALRRADADANVVVASVNPIEVERSSGYQAFRRTKSDAAERYASMATSVILGAGGLWHDYTIARAGGVAGLVTGAALSPAHLAQLPLMVRAYGGSFHVVGMGVGPLSDEAARATVRLTGMLASSITVRDEGSRDLLRGLESAWTARPVVAPDAVYSLELRPERAELDLPERYILLNVRPWGDGNAASLRLRDQVQRIAASLDIPVVALPMQPIDERVLIDDTRLASDYAAVVPSNLSGAQFLDVIERSAAVVSMRLHANLLAHRLGRPAVGFSYDEKVRSHFMELGRGDFVLDLTADDESITRALQHALAEQTLPDAVREKIREQETRAVAAVDAMAQAIASEPLQVSPTSGMVHIAPEPLAVAKKQSPQSREVWPASETVDVFRARVSSGNLGDPDAVVEHERLRRRDGDAFGLTSRAPQQGDFVEWDLTLPASTDEGARVELWIQQKYREKAKMRGYMAYSVLAGDRVLFTQDVVDWQPRNTVWIAMGPSAHQRHVRVRLHALRNCLDWNWGKATTITVERARSTPWGGSEPLVWGASSPYARNEFQAALTSLEQLASSTRSALDALAGQIPHPEAADGTEHVDRAPRVVSSAALRTALTSSGNLLDTTMAVEHSVSLSSEGARFGLRDRAPRHGDYVDWRLPVPRRDGTGCRVELTIQQKYPETKTVAGHMGYSVLVGDRELFSQDVTDWHPRNTVWVAIGSDEPADSVTVRLKALRDCPDWGWGDASPLTVESARILSWTGLGTRWGSSSPFAAPS